jgi:endonuclease YncB( thermonuclease family)
MALIDSIPPLGKTALLLLCLVVAPQLQGASLSGQVLKIESGDALVVISEAGRQRRVILSGIAAPPQGTPSARDAKKQLHMLLAGKFVTVVFNALTPAADILGQVLHGGMDINLRMLEFGLVRVQPEAVLGDETRRRYQDAQGRAQRSGLGIWRRSLR